MGYSGSCRISSRISRRLRIGRLEGGGDALKDLLGGVVGQRKVPVLDGDAEGRDGGGPGEERGNRELGGESRGG